MTELIIVAFVSLIIGAGIGSCLSVSVSNKLLSNEIANAESKYEDIGKNFGKGDFNPGNIPSSSNKDKDNSKSEQPKQFNFGVATVNEVKSIDAAVDLKVLAELLGIGLLLTLASSLVSMIAIARFSPLQILKERS